MHIPTLTVPGATIEKECQQRIAAINAVVAFSFVQEGPPSRPILSRKRSVGDDAQSPPAKRNVCQQEDETTLVRAITLVQISSSKERPTVCFLCVGDPTLPMKMRTWNYKTPGSLTRHMENKHIKPPWPEGGKVQCNVCKVELERKAALLNHAESKHGTVSRKCFSILL
jgi:hypothetical protein